MLIGVIKIKNQLAAQWANAGQDERLLKNEKTILNV
jgi:hypothetical protein